MIARKSLIPMGNVVVGALLGLVALKVTSIYLGTKIVGELEIALGVLGILYLFADLAMDQAHVKRVSEGVDASDCFVTFATFRAVSSFAFVVLAGLIFVLYTSVLGRTIEDTSVTALVFVTLYYVTKSVQNVAQSTFEARLEAARPQLGVFIETVTRVGLTLLGTFAYRALAVGDGPLAGVVDEEWGLARWARDEPAGALAAAYFLGTALAALAMVVFLVRSFEARRGRFRWPILKSYFAFAIPLFLPTSAALIAYFIDRTMLGFFGTNVDTALFAYPRRLVSVIEGLSAAAGIILFPTISAIVARGDRATIAPLVDRSLRYMSMLVLPLIAMLAFFPEAFLSLLLSDEWSGTQVALTLTTLAVYAYVVVVSRPHLNLLMGHGHARVAGRIALTAALLTILLNLVLVPDDIKSLGITLFGLKALGAALATLLPALLAYALLVRATKRIEGYVPNVQFWKHILAALVMGFSVMGLAALTGIEVHRWYTVVAYSAIGTLVYAGVLVLLRELTKDDARFIGDTLHPGEMWRYVRGEFGGRR